MSWGSAIWFIEISFSYWVPLRAATVRPKGPSPPGCGTGSPAIAGGLRQCWEMAAKWEEWSEPPRAGDISNSSHRPVRSEEHTSELQSRMRISYAVFCVKKKKDLNRNGESQ